MSGKSEEARLRTYFLGWQCRLRQHAVRRHGGRPSPGMQPRVRHPGGDEIAPAMTVLLVEASPARSTAEFRHIVRRTHDPERRYRDALKTLTAAHFQHPGRFSDVLTALFAARSALADTLVAAGACVLEFEQFGQGFRIPCAVAALAADDPAYQATYWHNAMFNTAMPGAIRILAFAPDWRRATAHPPV